MTVSLVLICHTGNLRVNCFLQRTALVKVQPYSIPASFLKVEYLRTELKEDIGIVVYWLHISVYEK